MRECDACRREYLPILRPAAHGFGLLSGDDGWHAATAATAATAGWDASNAGRAGRLAALAESGRVAALAITWLAAHAESARVAALAAAEWPQQCSGCARLAAWRVAALAAANGWLATNWFAAYAESAGVAALAAGSASHGAAVSWRAGDASGNG